MSLILKNAFNIFRNLLIFFPFLLRRVLPACEYKALLLSCQFPRPAIRRTFPSYTFFSSQKAFLTLKRGRCAFKLRLNSLLLRNDVTRPFAAAAAYAPCGICASTKRKLKHFMLYYLAFTPLNAAGFMMPSNSSDEKSWHA